MTGGRLNTSNTDFLCDVDLVYCSDELSQDDSPGTPKKKKKEVKKKFKLELHEEHEQLFLDGNEVSGLRYVGQMSDPGKNIKRPNVFFFPPGVCVDLRSRSFQDVRHGTDTRWVRGQRIMTCMKCSC